MHNITIKEKAFEPYISSESIHERVVSLSNQINRDYKDLNPVFLAVLNGSFMFASDLMKYINVRSEISFTKLSSYEKTESSGKITELIGLGEEIRDRNVVIIEDIVDTGRTLKHLIGKLEDQKAKSIKTVALLSKPEARVEEVDVAYVGFEIPKEFVLGYGLDYDGYGRNLPSIYKLVD
ncbi:MAG: hypoxanthine phosphoribosyltransferase [Cyclobacteriaceae bacterium]|nr:hypoxanthine phosphoribosyltransferase [Cyclobacteriaceae bacterium]MCH8516389.1 hypoxanthine phosphoribosyltransferase [Cyclobacteriaceae bacterium]